MKRKGKGRKEFRNTYPTYTEFAAEREMAIFSIEYLKKTVKDMERAFKSEEADEADQSRDILGGEIESLEKKLEYMKRVLGMEKNSNERSKVKKQVRQIKAAISEKENVMKLFRYSRMKRQVTSNRFRALVHKSLRLTKLVDEMFKEDQIYEVVGLERMKRKGKGRKEFRNTYPTYTEFAAEREMAIFSIEYLKQTVKDMERAFKSEEADEADQSCDILGGEIESLEKKLEYMKRVLGMEKNSNERSKVKKQVRQIKAAISEKENVMKLFRYSRMKRQVTSNRFRALVHKSLRLTKLVDEMFKEDQIYEVVGDSSSSGGSNTSEVADEKVVVGFKEEVETLMGKLHDSNTSKVADEKVVVGFKEEVETLMGKLQDSGEGGRLEIISIVGAAGGGKTTLAREVYDHPWTSHTFEIRAWVNIFQDYNKTMKRNLLIRILELISPNKNGDYKESSEDELGEEMLKCLKGKKYLIVMDDIWDIEAWNDIQRSLPKDCNGSKVLFTSRVCVEPNGIYYIPHFLAPLPKSCSWELLQKKVFGKKSCPPELVDIGEHIAEKCDGLPLAIVAIAGILAMEDKKMNVWQEVSKRLSSIIAKNQDDCMEILELSYNHLPFHLKACFVYIGGFPEDSEILIRELIWLWIAEGFIQQSEGDKSLEDVAKDYLSSLIDRSLVTVARKRSFGGIKACRIHDLLRELCLKKAEEDNFLLQIYRHDTFSPSAATRHRRLFIGSQFFHEFSLRPCTRNLRSFLCLSLQNSTRLSFETNLSFFVKNFELLRVLCFISAECQGKIGRGHLVHLRYLALQLPKDKSDIVWPFSYLFNLETVNLQARSWKTILLPLYIFKMVKLRHLYAKRGVFKYHFSGLYPNIAVGIGFDRWSKLDSLQTLHPICPCEECRNFLARTPNLRKLGFCGDLISNDHVLMLPNLEFLKCLKTLSFHQYISPTDTTTLLPVLKFPPTITQLTLENTCLKWEELSILQTLPSLEILKLSTRACRGQIWNTSELEEGFSQLKYLRLQDLDIEEWNASEDQFPRLEVLVVTHCAYLEQIPINFANLNELRKIEVRRSHRSVEESAREIQKERRNMRGDDDCINLLLSSQ